MTKRGFPFALALLFACTAGAQESSPATGAKPKKPAPAAAAQAKPETDAAAAKEDVMLTFAPIGTAVVKGDNVNVRGLPSFNGEVITRLKKGETLTLLEEITLKKPAKGEPTNWFRIALPRNTPVWVFADFIDANAKTVKPPRLNVRAGPGENYSVVARLKKGDEIQQIRKVEDWIEMEAPATAFGFVASELVEKQLPPSPAPTPAPPAPEPPAPAPAPAPEVVVVPESEQPKVATPEPVEAPQPIEAPAPAPPPVVIAPVPEAPEVAPRRVITREGIVRRARNIQAPTYYQLEGLDDGNLINYLHSPEELQLDPKTKKMKPVPKTDLTEYIGRRAIVTGEEVIDKRWRFTPVLVIETIEIEQ